MESLQARFLPFADSDNTKVRRKMVSLYPMLRHNGVVPEFFVKTMH